MNRVGHFAAWLLLSSVYFAVASAEQLLAKSVRERHLGSRRDRPSGESDEDNIICRLIVISSLPTDSNKRIQPSDSLSSLDSYESFDESSSRDEAELLAREWYCAIENEDGSDTTYYLDSLPQTFVEKNLRELLSGIVYIEIEGGRIKPGNIKRKDKIIVPDDPDSVRIFSPPRSDSKHSGKKLSNTKGKSPNTKGKRRVLVLKVRSMDLSVSLRRKELGQSVFGGKGGPEDNLVSQYKGCSHNQVRFIPAKGKKIAHGVGNIYVNMNATDVDSSVVANRALEAATKKFGRLTPRYDHVMVVLPSGVYFGYAAAWAWVGGYLSCFREAYATNAFVQVHEFGHNLGLGHSGENDWVYGDYTCSQGAPYRAKTCFNGHKSWQLGWYKDRHAIVRPRGGRPWKGKLVGATDYPKAGKRSYVVVTVETEEPFDSKPDLFLMLNRKEGPNAEVREKQNRVTVVEANSPDAYYSWARRGLEVFGLPLRINRFDGGKSDLIIEVCSMSVGEPDVAEVAIYLDDGDTPSPCN